MRVIWNTGAAAFPSSHSTILCATGDGSQSKEEQHTAAPTAFLIYRETAETTAVNGELVLLFTCTIEKQ